MSLFITFEGGEGCGKSIQSKELYDRLYQQNIPAVLTHEPGGTPLGDEISHLLKDNKDAKITPLTELFLFNASRSQLLDTVIKPALGKGQTVICDRFADSTIVYQGYGRGLDLKVIKAINNTAAGGLTPSLTILLDLPVEQGLARKGKENHDRFEREVLEFHQRVRDGYLKLAAAEPGRWLVIDATQGKEQIAEIVWHKVSQILNRRD